MAVCNILFIIFVDNYVVLFQCAFHLNKRSLQTMSFLVSWASATSVCVLYFPDLLHLPREEFLPTFVELKSHPFCCFKQMELYHCNVSPNMCN